MGLVFIFGLEYASAHGLVDSRYVQKFSEGVFIAVYSLAYLTNYLSIYQVTQDRHMLWASNICILVTLSLFLCLQTVPATTNNHDASSIFYFRNRFLDSHIGPANLMHYAAFLIITLCTSMLTISNCMYVLSYDLDNTWSKVLLSHSKVRFLF